MPILPYSLIDVGICVLSTQINQVVTTPASVLLLHWSGHKMNVFSLYICISVYVLRAFEFRSNVCMWKPQTDIRCLLCFPPCFLRQGLSLNLELANLARFLGQ